MYFFLSINVLNFLTFLNQNDFPVLFSSSVVKISTITNKRLKDIASLKHALLSLWWDSLRNEIGSCWAAWELPAHIVDTPQWWIRLLRGWSHSPIEGIRSAVSVVWPSCSCETAKLCLLHLGRIVSRKRWPPGLPLLQGWRRPRASTAQPSSLISWPTCQFISVLCETYWAQLGAHTSSLQSNSSVVFVCTSAPIHVCCLLVIKSQLFFSQLSSWKADSEMEVILLEVH